MVDFYKGAATEYEYLRYPAQSKTNKYEIEFRKIDRFFFFVFWMIYLKKSGRVKLTCCEGFYKIGIKEWGIREMDPGY